MYKVAFFCKRTVIKIKIKMTNHLICKRCQTNLTAGAKKACVSWMCQRDQNIFEPPCNRNFILTFEQMFHPNAVLSATKGDTKSRVVLTIQEVSTLEEGVARTVALWNIKLSFVPPDSQSKVNSSLAQKNRSGNIQSILIKSIIIWELHVNNFQSVGNFEVHRIDRKKNL